MKKMIGWFSIRQHSPAMARRMAGTVGVTILLLMAGMAAAQNPAAPIPTPSVPMSIPQGYSVHESVDLGGRMSDQVGSGAMYDTLVNLQSGPRVQGETFMLRALPGNNHAPVDALSLFSNGFGGDPNTFTKLDFYKGKRYEFSGLFRRDRRYFDYDLLGNSNTPAGLTLPIGPATNPTGAFAWPQQLVSPLMTNTVRRMTDTHLTIFPLSKVTFRVGYSQNVFEGPGLASTHVMPTNGAASAFITLQLEEFNRNSTDDWTGAIDWKPVEGTKLTFEEQIDHYKENSYFVLNPASLIVQEADGTPASLGNWNALPGGAGDIPAFYSIAKDCNTTSMMSSTTLLYPSPTTGGAPIIDAACNVATSYLRTQPSRTLYPTETFRFQSASIKNLTMNGDFRFTKARMSLPFFSENFAGLDTKLRTYGFTGNASGYREVVATDLGIVWQVAKAVSLSDQIEYSNVHQPGSATTTSETVQTTPTTAGDETINYQPLTTTVTTTVGASAGQGNPYINSPLQGYFGLRLFNNDFTATWEATERATFSLTYRHRARMIATGTNDQGNNDPIPTSDTDFQWPVNGVVVINEDGGIFNAAVRPTNKWDIDGSVEAFYDDNGLTPLTPRQTRRYRVHTKYTPKPGATIWASYNDSEEHANTFNNEASIAVSQAYYGPVDHVDHSRIFGVGTVVAPNEHYELDLNYAYSDVYSSTNGCFATGNAATLPGTATIPGSVPSSVTAFANGICGTVANPSGPDSSGLNWFARDFMSAPTQSGSAAITLSPNKNFNANLGYRISKVSGSRFFQDARDVSGSLNSTYQTPYMSLAWTRHAWTWKAGYDFFGYGEGGPSGAEYCSLSGTGTSTVVPCTSLASSGLLTGLTEPTSGNTAPRVFHANNVMLGVHYEF